MKNKDTFITMMKKQVFLKKNIFSCVMFGAIFLFVVYQTIFNGTDLAMLAFLISLPTFVLSLIKLLVDFLEDINDRMTRYLQSKSNNGVPFNLMYDAKKITMRNY